MLTIKFIHYYQGFTLVEIALVLVVIGLMISSFLKGQEMITNAKLKRIESDNAAIAAALFSYQDRYMQLPGDDRNAADRFQVYATTDPVNGDGTGTIDGNWDAVTSNDVTTATTVVETNLFFAHLRAAGLIPGNGIDDTKPTNAFGGLIGVRDGALGIAGHVTVFGQIEGSVAKILESRLDEGTPSQGRIQSGISSGSTPIDVNTADTGNLVYMSSSRYNMVFRL
ncbi:MAG: prepilin-type N-terminal cleavage/methylation domain-containing protein [Proteobacteria bacterium]|nr:prepilin-type N-terminal cleavage/methylation domain-containing protein [Pseudomonadota bacterium]